MKSLSKNGSRQAMIFLKGSTGWIIYLCPCSIWSFTNHIFIASNTDQWEIRKSYAILQISTTRWIGLQQLPHPKRNKGPMLCKKTYWPLTSAVNIVDWAGTKEKISKSQSIHLCVQKTRNKPASPFMCLLKYLAPSFIWLNMTNNIWSKISSSYLLQSAVRKTILDGYNVTTWYLNTMITYRVILSQ